MALEKVVISFEGDTSALQPVLAKLKEMGTISDQNAEKFKNASDKHKRGLSDTGDEVSRIEQKMRNLGERIVAVFAVERIVQFGEECIKAFEDAEKSAKKLAFAVENINGGGKEGLSLLTEQAKNLSEELKNLFSVKQIENVQTQLAQAKISTEQISRLVPIILDVAQATGDSLDTVSEKIVQTSQLGGRALTSYGAKFGDTGDKVKNLDMAIQQLSVYTGSAADAMGSYAAQEQQASNNADELMEKIGSELTPIWVGLKTEVLSAAQSLIDFFENTDYLAADYKKDVDAYTTSLKSMTDAQLADQETYYDALQNNYEASIQAKIDANQRYIDSGRDASLQQYEYTDAQKKADVEAAKAAEDKYSAIIKEEAARKSATDQAVKDADTNASLQVDLTKLTEDELQARLDDLEDNLGQQYYIGNTWDQKGINAEEERIRKEQERRKKAYDDAIAQQKTFEQTLLALKTTIADNEAQADIDAIRDANAKKAAEENNDFRKKQVILEEQRTKLNEIILKGTKDEQDQARTLLAETYVEEEKEYTAHLQKMQDILRESWDEYLKFLEKQKTTELQYQSDRTDAIATQQKLALKAKLDASLITQKEYDKQAAQIDLDAAKTKAANQVAIDQADLEEAQRVLDEKTALGEDTMQAAQDVADAQNKLNLDQIKGANDVADAQNKLTEAMNETSDEQTKILENMFSALQDFMAAFEDAIQANIDAIDTQMTAQNRMIDYQKTLAEKGLANDLAFEEKKADQLAEKKLKEQRKLERAKEFETFWNSVAKYSEDDPKGAIRKALEVVAGAKIAETLFAEEGGIVGSRLPRAFGRRHKSGRDRLVMAEDGEGILSKREMDLLGGESGFMKMRNFIKDPLRERMIPSSHVSIMRNDNSEIVKELNAVKKAVENIPQMRIEWEGLDARIETKIQNGVEERMKVLTGKRRL